MRPATAADSALLLEWANDPETRAASFNQRRIEPDEHARWLAATLASPDVFVLIGLEEERPVGQIRFVRDGTGAAEISISVAPEARGRGVGRRMLEAAIETVRQDHHFGTGRLRARVRPDNARSIAMFLSLGFEIVGQADVNNGTSLEFQLVP